MLIIKDLSLHFGDRTLFDHLNLTIKNGEKVSLVGRNGVGKTTLFKLISGQQRPDSGGVQFPKDARIGVLEQDIANYAGHTVRSLCLTAFPELEEQHQAWAKLEEAMNQAQTDDEMIRISAEMADLGERMSQTNSAKKEGAAEKILKGLGFRDEDMDRPVEEFSGGWQMRILLGKLLLMEPDFLLLDEPTNHLDIVSVIWLENYLKDYPGTYIVISHDKRFLNAVSKKVIELDRAKASVYVGDYDNYLIERVLQREILQNAFKNQQAEIERKERLIDKYRAKASKAKTAKALQSELARMDKIELDTSEAKTMNIRFPEVPRSAERVLECERLGHAYDENQVFEDLDFNILRGQRVSLIGQNGQGKTTLAKIITNKLRPTSGHHKVGENVLLRYFAQNEGEMIDGDMTVLDWLEHQATAETRANVRNVLGAFLFSQEDVDKKVKVLSGGERSRLAMAAMILQPMNFLILDEPTNHLDLQSKDVLKEALQHYSGALLVISHDREFLKELTDHTLILHDGRLTHHLGDVDSFLNKQGFDSLMSFAMSGPQENKEKKERQDHRSDRDQKNLERKIKQIEDKIEQAEVKKAKIEAEMAADGFYESEESEKVLGRYRKIQDEIKSLHDSWDDLVHLL
jgi:ATP-binding cassette subfamily F protein 3